MRRYIYSTHPVVVLKRSDVCGRDECAEVFNSENSLSRKTILRQEVVDRRAKELSINQKIEGNGRGCGEKSVYKGGELETAEICRHEYWPRILWKDVFSLGRQADPDLRHGNVMLCAVRCKSRLTQNFKMDVHGDIGVKPSIALYHEYVYQIRGQTTFRAPR